MNFLLNIVDSGVVDNIGGGTIGTTAPTQTTTPTIDDPTVYAYLLMGLILGVIIGIIATIFMTHILNAINKKDSEIENGKSETNNTSPKEGE